MQTQAIGQGSQDEDLSVHPLIHALLYTGYDPMISRSLENF